MNAHIQDLLRRIKELDEQLQEAPHKQPSEMLYQITGKKIRIKKSVRNAHRKLKMNLFPWLCASHIRNVLSALFIYAMVVPDGLS